MKKKSPSKGRRKASPDPEPQTPVILHGNNNWLKEICNAQISTAVALAVIVFAAGSVMAIAQLASPDISGYSDVSLLNVARAQTRVLGDTTTTIDDTALEAGDPAGSISAKPVSFDSTAGRWDYNISYSVSNLTGTATLTIGTYVVQSGITASGQVETGSILKPSFTYHVSLWSQDSSGNKQLLGQYQLKTGKTKTSTSKPLPQPCLLGQPTGSSTAPMASSTYPSTATFCLKSQSGKQECSPRPCGLMPQGQPGSGDNQPGQGPGNGTPPAYPSTASTTPTVLISIPRNAVAGSQTQAAAGIFPHTNVTFTFSWGDGSSNDVQTTPGPYFNAMHTYATAGSYTFTATAVDSNNNSYSKTGSIVVASSSVSGNQ